MSELRTQAGRLAEAIAVRDRLLISEITFGVECVLDSRADCWGATALARALIGDMRETLAAELIKRAEAEVAAARAALIAAATEAL